MDYSPINIAPKGKKQGDYYTTTIGPYDYWAIEYAYKPVDGDEAAELKKIAARAPEPDLVYATDEDVVPERRPARQPLGPRLRPLPVRQGPDRAGRASCSRTWTPGWSRTASRWARIRRRLRHPARASGATAPTWPSQYIGGQSVSRDHKGDKDARDPIVPVAGAKQRECLKFLVDEILSDKAFQFSPALLRRLGTERWMHWGNERLRRGRASTIPVYERILGIQKIVLGQCLDADVLARLQNQELQADPGADPLRMAEVFRSLTDGIWSDLDDLPADAKDAKAAKLALSTIRRNLQREYLRRLGAMVLGDRAELASATRSATSSSSAAATSVPADARALARLHLKEIGEPDRQGPRRQGRASSTTPPAPTSRSAGTGSPRSSRPISTSSEP